MSFQECGKGPHPRISGDVLRRLGQSKAVIRETLRRIKRGPVSRKKANIWARDLEAALLSLGVIRPSEVVIYTYDEARRMLEEVGPPLLGIRNDDLST